MMRSTSGPAVKLNPRNFRRCGLCHCALRLIHPELESLRDESREALLADPLAAYVDVGVVRIPNKAVSAAFQLPVEFVDLEVADQ
jgi:hypothetical protein